MQTYRQRWFRLLPSDPFYMLLLGVDKDEGRAEGWGDFGRSLAPALIFWLA